MVYAKLKRKYPGRYAELHAHSEFSDGLKFDYIMIKVSDIEAVAITDHAVAYGVKSHLDEMKKIGKVGIVGCELNTGNMLNSLHGISVNHKKGYYHLVILVKNQRGYKNFCKLLTLASKKKANDSSDGNSYLTFKDLKKYSEGLVCLSGCIGGEISQYLLNNQYEYAETLATEFKKIFGDDFYLEIQRHGITGEELVNEGLIKLSKQLDIPLVATSDAHYMTEDDKELHKIQCCKKYSGKKTLTLDKYKGMEGDDYHLIKSIEYIENKWRDLPQALDSTIEIMEKCKGFELKDAECVEDYHFPKFKVPEDLSPEVYFLKLCYEAADRLIEAGVIKDKDKLYAALDRETNTMMELGFVEYFLIVQGIIQNAKKKNIWIGPGRGSVGGSVVAFLLGITSDLFPLDYNFSFDRFLNIHRKGMPDIDIDIDSLRRDEVIFDTREEYKIDEEASNIAYIATFNTWGVKGGINDVGRILGYKESFFRKISKLVPDLPGITFDDAFKASPKLREFYDENEDVRTIVDYAKRLYGTKTSLSRHPSGLIIADKSLSEYISLDLIKDKDSGGYITLIQCNKEEAEKLGLLKIDMLGLSTGTDITETRRLIRERKGIDLNLSKIPLDDEDVYFDVFAGGKTVGIFQSESRSMTKVLRDIFSRIKKYKLSTSFLLALIQGICSNRPGPKDSIPDFLENLVSPENITYTHEKMETVLSDTHGILTYQEQVAKLFEVLAGYSSAKADLARRAVSKKDMDLLEKERKVFIYGNEEVLGCVNNGIDAAIAEEIFDTIVKFARYAFNMSHGGMYGLLTYHTAYLKHHYPVEYMTAVLSGRCRSSNTRKKLGKYITECKRLGIKILPPDVNKSSVDFTIEGENSIRFGLLAIKHVGLDVCKSIVYNRCNGDYKNVNDFAGKLKDSLNSKEFQALALSGALDSLGGTRKNNVENAKSILDRATTGSVSLFDILPKLNISNSQPTTQPQQSKENEYSIPEMMEEQQNHISCFLAETPLSAYNNIIENSNTYTLTEFMVEAFDDEDGEDDDNDYIFDEGDIARTIAMVINIEDRGDYVVYKVTDGVKVMSGTANGKYRDILKVGNVVHLNGRVHYDSFGTSLKGAKVSRVFSSKEDIYLVDEFNIGEDSTVEAYISSYLDIPKFLHLLDLGQNTPCETTLYFNCNQTKKIFEFDYKIPLNNSEVLKFLKANTEGLIIR